MHVNAYVTTYSLLGVQDEIVIICSTTAHAVHEDTPGAALVVAVAHRAEGDVVVLQAAVLGADEGRQQAPVRVQLVEELDVVLRLLPIRCIATRLQSYGLTT